MIEEFGYGALRTGFADDDMLLTLKANDSHMGHNHYDQLSFQITANGLWPAADPGYSNLSTGFDEQEGHNTIIVDGLGQNVKPTGSLRAVVDGQLYGQLSGSAPNAYS